MEVNSLIAKSVMVTGHRIVEDLDEKKLEEIFKLLIKKGYTRFYIGMALGFDTICFKILEKLRENNDITLIACIPCREQDKYFTDSQKEEYARMLKSANEKHLLSEKFTSYCMYRRNCYMVDHSAIVVAYLRKSFGGTFNTVKYAEKKCKKIINI
ncbi:MAG TPA: DUF1273 domain-containing protein [Clostridiales bacterium]|nr:DUF1273 domain-containing protein [Clostridiales bacterium]